MNLALHGIDGNLADRADSSFTADLHPDLRADFIITNPPFNLGEKGTTGWGRSQLMEDPRWSYGLHRNRTRITPGSNIFYTTLRRTAPPGSSSRTVRCRT